MEKLQQMRIARAVAFLKSELGENTKSLLRQKIKESPELWWAEVDFTFESFHFGLGTAIRNSLRVNGFGEDELGVANLDDIYISLVEQAVQLPVETTWQKQHLPEWRFKSAAMPVNAGIILSVDYLCAGGFFERPLPTANVPSPRGEVGLRDLGLLSVRTDAHDSVSVVASAEWMAKNDPEPGHYYVAGIAGSAAVSAEAFESLYERIDG